MQLVIDSNALQSPLLRDFLSKTASNKAVLPDYVSMEAHKGDTLRNIFDRMKVVADFPNQVVVLRGTKVVAGLRGRAARLQRRLIDESQTSEFATYARHLLLAQAGNRSLQAQILELGRSATEYLDHIHKESTAIATSLIEVTQAFTGNERRLVKTGARYSPEMIDKLVRRVMEISARLFRHHPNVKRIPSFEELPNTFLFRVSMCMFLLGLRWTANGRSPDLGTARLRNDMVDMFVVTYATYFDGIMSSDKNACRIHREVRLLLKEAFDCALPSGVGVTPGFIEANDMQEAS